jgi:hypothetical protein
MTTTYTPSNPKHPEVEVQLTGQDGNAFMVLGLVQKALKQHGYDAEVSDFYDEATSGDYDHLLQTAMSWVTVY